MLGWDWYGFDKKNVMTHYVELVFFHPLRYAGHVVQSGASGVRNIDALFFMLWWDRYRFRKKRIGTCYVDLVFLHLVGSAGRVMHSSVKLRCNMSRCSFCGFSFCIH
jgi:hypothetical protein